MVKNASLSVIDLSGFHEGSCNDKISVAKKAIQACETAGFFYIRGHGIDREVFENAKKSALQFFRMPKEFKSKVHISTVSHHRGYVRDFEVAPDPKKGGDIREAYKVAADLSLDDPDYLAGITLYGPNIWPQGMPEFEKDIYHCFQQFQLLSNSLFRLFAIGLDLPENFFVPLIQKPASVMNVNYYRARDGADNLISSGIGAHSDYEAFAMLWQDNVGGLQIESLQGEWEAVQPLEDALVINIGDLMQHWTNDRFRATRHRVTNISNEERVSLACFGNTNYHAMIECLPSCCNENNPVRYPPKTSGQYLMEAITRTYSGVKDS